MEDVQFDYLSVAYPVRPEAPPYVRKYYYVERPGDIDIIIPVELLPPEVTVTTTYAPSDIMSKRPLAFNSGKSKDLFYLQDPATKEINFSPKEKLPKDVLLIIRQLEVKTPSTGAGASGAAGANPPLTPESPVMPNYPPPPPYAEHE